MTNNTIATVALLERRPDISRSLFTRYWRDVHGVMAARIPGFENYTQHHVTPISTGAVPFEGIAIVQFKCEADRIGLTDSDITQHIHRDEQNLFRRALLYNLGPNDVEIVKSSLDATGQTMFVVLADSEDVATLVELLGNTAKYLAVYNLANGDPSGWNSTDASGLTFGTMIHGIWDDAASATAAAAGVALTYFADETHVMVADGRPTAVGLRGLDAVNTILEANADNQLQGDVVRAIYGSIAAR